MQTRTSITRPLFLEFNGRRLFAVEMIPTGPCTGAVLYLPPFAEEMNRLRSHAAAQARAFAALGLRTLLLDHYGTGESEGGTADVDWTIWRDDSMAAARWLHEQSGHTPTAWGARTGALLAAELAADSSAPVSRLLFWQPVSDGQVFLTQYLRLRIASQVVSDGERETTEMLLQRLHAGEVVEVAGYPLTGGMADALAQRRLGSLLQHGRQPVAWIEVVAKPEQPLAPASRRVLQDLAEGRAVQSRAAACPMVWQVAKRVDAPELIAATLDSMQEPAWT